MKIKTIDIQAKQWFDKINGNSYFSANITINYGTDTQQNIFLPFQYGYGDHYQDMAGQELLKLKLVKKDKDNFYFSLWKYCQDKKIILRTAKICNCLKRDLNN